MQPRTRERDPAYCKLALTGARLKESAVSCRIIAFMPENRYISQDAIANSRRRLSYASALGLILALTGTVALGLPPFWAMGFGTIMAATCAKKRDNLAQSKILKFALDGMGTVRNVTVLVLLVATMTSAWFSSGTIQGLIYYGVSLVSPKRVLLAGLLLSSVLSTLIGSSVGTVATVGVAIMGIARAFNLPPAPVAGAIMSGAIFGDRISFLSGIFHLTVDMTSADERKASKRFLKSGVPALLLCVAAAFIMGNVIKIPNGGEGLAWQTRFLQGMAMTAKVTPWVLIPPALAIAMATLRVPVRLCLLAGLASGGVLAVAYQGAAPFTLLRTILMGYSNTGAGPEVAAVLRSGGLRGSVNMALLLVFAGMYTGIMESSGMMDDISGGIVGRLKSRTSFLLGAMCVSVASSMMAANQAMSVIIPGRSMSARRAELGVSEVEFAGALSDSGVPAAGVIPWSVMAAMCGDALQVAPLAFLPWTVIVFALPLFGVIIAIRSGSRYSEARLDAP